MKQNYLTLGLKEGASQEDIQAAYDKLSSELDPSKNNYEAFFVEEYKKVQKAYEALSNSSILSNDSVKFISPANTLVNTPNLTTKNNPKRTKMKVFKKILILFTFITTMSLVFYTYYEFMMIDTYSLLFNENKSEWLPTKISNEIVYVKNTMTPFTGKLYKMKCNYSGKFINGKKIGIHKEYSRSGDLIYEGEYKDGKPVGLHRKWSDVDETFYSRGQLLIEVNYKYGKRDGLNKIWDGNGNLIKLDYGENKINQYIKDYFQSYSNLDIIEGNYSVEERSSLRYEKKSPYYEFSIIKIYDKFYAVMTKPFKIKDDDSKQFFIGDVKAIFTKKEQSTEYTFDWFMADKSISLGNTAKYDISSNTLVVFNQTTYYKQNFEE